MLAVGTGMAKQLWLDRAWPCPTPTACPGPAPLQSLLEESKLRGNHLWKERSLTAGPRCISFRAPKLCSGLRALLLPPALVGTTNDCQNSVPPLFPGTATSFSTAATGTEPSPRRIRRHPKDSEVEGRPCPGDRTRDACRGFGVPAPEDRTEKAQTMRWEWGKFCPIHPPHLEHICRSLSHELLCMVSPAACWRHNRCLCLCLHLLSATTSAQAAQHQV